MSVLLCRKTQWPGDDKNFSDKWEESSKGEPNARLKEGGLYHSSAKFAPAGELNFQLIFRHPFERATGKRIYFSTGKNQPPPGLLEAAVAARTGANFQGESFRA
jgi:hypothetical protein